MIVTGVVRDGQESVDGDADALFEIGSITKVFTGVLLAELAERGEVALDDPLHAYLDVPLAGASPTLEELATHQSGLPNTPAGFGRRELAFLLGVPGARDPWHDVTEEAFWRVVAGTRRRRRRFRYSSLGFELLGRALARAADRPYEALVRERICGPLGLEDTWVHVPEAGRGRLLPGHSRRGRPRPPLEDHLAAAGGVRSSVRDLLRFLRACLDPPATPPGAALALARQPHLRVNRRLAVGLGWLIVRDGLVWHNGGTWGFRSFAGFAPERGRAAVVLSNTARSVDRLGFRLVGAGARSRH